MALIALLSVSSSVIVFETPYADAKDQLICDVARCSPLAFTVPSVIQRNAGQQDWAREEIWSYIEEILQVAGLRPNFILVATGEVGNAAALIHENQRVLAYNPTWIANIASTEKWSMYGLLAHELGHHLQGHTLLPGGSKPPTELEADQYAGFVLGRLGADDAQAVSLWMSLSETGSETHPPRQARLTAVREGWQRANGGTRRAPDTETVAYIMPDSATRLLTENDAAGLTGYALRLARNEIFARHGYIFNSADLDEHFRKQPWYSAASKSVQLSATEKANVDFLVKLESAAGDAGTTGMIFPQSSIRMLAHSEVAQLDERQKRLARNEIYARRGYIFNDPSLASHFSGFAWYKPVRRSVELSEIERRNVRLIRNSE